MRLSKALFRFKGQILRADAVAITATKFRPVAIHG
jgi:hypothetical protein